MLSARFIRSGFSDAATNMAVDEALFLSFKEGDTLPTLRLYGWRPKAFSIGYSQLASDVLDLEACRKDQIDIVRRPTGGGVLYHSQEISYSIVLAQRDIGLGRGVKDSFATITSFLITALKDLGVEAAFAKHRSPAPLAASSIADLCFSRKEEYDILAGAQKIGGNAQKRRRNIILQHGSLPFSFDKKEIAPFLKNPDLLASLDVVTIGELAKTPVGFDDLSERLAKAFSAHFQTVLKEGALTAEEEQLAQALKTDKYQNDDWNLTGEKIEIDSQKT